ncbi:MAG: hypothetical protein JRH10_21195 [Deltaproteobacteria bacterium]|nr:hypothetical protein [Deltaproteobacteria bacterium]
MKTIVALKARTSRLLAVAALGLTAGFGLPGCGDPPILYLDSPTHGQFLLGTTVNVSGRAYHVTGYQNFTVNGVPVAGIPGGFWNVDVPLDPSAIFNPIVVEITLAGGRVIRERATVIVGDGVNSGFVLDGSPSPQAVALRLGDTGLGQIAPIVENLSGDAIDISSLIPDQNPIAQGSFSGISYVANGVDVSIGGFGLTVDATASGLDTTVSVSERTTRSTTTSRPGRTPARAAATSPTMATSWTCS